jgi:hypothetical protein
MALPWLRETKLALTPCMLTDSSSAEEGKTGTKVRVMCSGSLGGGIWGQKWHESRSMGEGLE